MPDRPLLTLPGAMSADPPKGNGRGPRIGFPSKSSQIDRLDPVFDRLSRLILRGNELELRADPSSLAPDRVIVFEVAGSLRDFSKALARVPGFELFAEVEDSFDPDEGFSTIDRNGNPTPEKPIGSRLYLAMPDVLAFRELLSLWDRWKRGEKPRRGFAPFNTLFGQLYNLRSWGPQDRISEQSLEFWQDEISTRATTTLRVEADLWFHSGIDLRRKASTNIRSIVKNAGGAIVHEFVLPEIAYHGMLIEISAGEISNLINRTEVTLALADDIMFLHPQSILASPSVSEIDDEAEDYAHQNQSRNLYPIAALLDGVPLAGHQLLSNRLIIDDPDDIQGQAIVSKRLHGTSMASLILYGDLNSDDGNIPLEYPLYFRPILYTSEEDGEHSSKDRLIIDTIYQAIERMKGTGGDGPAAPTVFLVNLSIGDGRRPFSGVMSPLANLLDFLAVKYGLLFLVSAGNVRTPLQIPSFTSWTAFEQAEPNMREQSVISALNLVKHERTIISPAESINAITIGAHHDDNLTTRIPAVNSIDPFSDNLLPNISSALGLGFRRTVKPDIYFPGGREYVRMNRTGDELVITSSLPGRTYGLLSATPDTSGTGRLNRTALTSGTSAATALATRAAQQIFNALINDDEDESPLAEMPPEYYAVVIKALLVHCASWADNAKMIENVVGPSNIRRGVERAENVSRFVGFGSPRIQESCECSANRATLIGFGELIPGTACVHRIPLPECLRGVTSQRSITITLGWFSPISKGHHRYRGVKLEASPLTLDQVLGTDKRTPLQPAYQITRRGTIFHEHYSGSRATSYIDDDFLRIRISCLEDAAECEHAIRYGLAVTIESEDDIPVYDQIRDRLRIQQRPPI